MKWLIVQFVVNVQFCSTNIMNCSVNCWVFFLNSQNQGYFKLGLVLNRGDSSDVVTPAGHVTTADSGMLVSGDVVTPRRLVT